MNPRIRCVNCGVKIDHKALKDACNEMRVMYGETTVGDKQHEIRADSYRHFVTTFKSRECCYSYFEAVCCNLPIWRLERPAPPR